jgi:hypothetical protein
MVSPATANPPGQIQIEALVEETSHSAEVRPSGGESATSRFLDTFGFHLLVVLLGIALAFM